MKNNKNQNKMKTATINKPNSNSHGKTVFIHHNRGYRYSCSFTEKGDIYFFNKSDLIFEKERQAFNLPKVNQLITGLPSSLKGKKFRIKEFVHGKVDVKNPKKFIDYPQLRYYSEFEGKHLFFSEGVEKIVLICEIL